MVHEEGGYEEVTLAARWSYVATKRMSMPTPNNKCYGSVLKGHYEKHVYPYDLFQAEVTYDAGPQPNQPKKGATSSPLKKVL